MKLLEKDTKHFKNACMFMCLINLSFFLYECLFVKFACLSTDLTEKYEIPGDKIIDDKDFLS